MANWKVVEVLSGFGDQWCAITCSVISRLLTLWVWAIHTIGVLAVVNDTLVDAYVVTDADVCYFLVATSDIV